MASRRRQTTYDCSAFRPLARAVMRVPPLPFKTLAKLVQAPGGIEKELTAAEKLLGPDILVLAKPRTAVTEALDTAFAARARGW